LLKEKILVVYTMVLNRERESMCNRKDSKSVRVRVRMRKRNRRGSEDRERKTDRHKERGG
jgi:hypothetical protein